MDKLERRRAVWPQATHYAGIVDRSNPGHWQELDTAADTDDHDKREPKGGDDVSGTE